MVTKRTREASPDADAIAAFGEQFEKHPPKPAEVKPPVEAFIEGLPPWKQRNLEPKRIGTQFRCSESQIALLRVASLDQEMSIQKILERLVWPAIEERYGVTTEDSPS